MQSCYFKIAGKVFSVRFNESEGNGLRLLPSFRRFQTAETADDIMFDILVGEETPRDNDSVKIKTFETGNGEIEVSARRNGGYQFQIRDIRGRDCALFLTDKDFTNNRCTLIGDDAMRSFGLNNALMMSFAFSGAKYGILLIHASSVIHNSLGYAFVAKSGTGKSTHTSLWMKHIDDVELLNDDNPVLRVVDDKVYIYGSPWSGKTPCYKDKQAQLGAITKISRAGENSIERLAPVDAFAALLLSCSTIKWDAEIYGRICDVITKVVEKIPIYILHCLPDEEAARICHKEIAR